MMLQTALRLLGFDLRLQASRLAERVQDAKREFYGEIREAITELKAEAVGTGINIGLVIVAAEFAFLALIAGLAAIFVWIAPEHGPMPALLGIALACLLMAGVLFAVARARSTQPPAAPRLPEASGGHARALAPPLVQAAPDLGRLGPDAHERLARHGAAAAEEIAARIEDVFQHGSRKAILGTVVVTMLAGVAVGWRWRG